MNDSFVQTISTSTSWSWTVLVIAILIGLAVIGMTIRNVRYVRSRSRKILIVTLRTLTVGVLLAMLMEPVQKQRLIRRVRSHIAVLVDVSQSMSVSSSSGTRLDRARKWLDLESTGPDAEVPYTIHRYTFGENLKPWDGEASSDSVEANESSTLILESLSQLASGVSTKDVAGVILVTDGVDNGALHWLQKGRKNLAREVRQVLDRLNAPIHVVHVGARTGFMDVRVDKIKAPSFVFAKNAASLDAHIEVQGALPEKLTVELFEDGKLVRTEKVPTVTDKRNYKVTLPFVARYVGERVYTVRVGAWKGEIFKKNNERSVLIPCIRDRIRVLQVAGHPSYDQRFLREYLRTNPNVDLVSFFILVDQHDARFRGDETSLIPFPVKELFVDELPGFDLVIFQDFKYRPFGAGAHLDRIQEFVEQGGAFMVVGGGRSYEFGQYENTPLESLLPVNLESEGASTSVELNKAFKPLLAKSAEHHPILRLLPDREENLALFKSLPKLDGLNRSVAVKPTATVLLSHPTLKNKAGENLPVVALQEVKKGRTLSILTDSMWRWNFVQSGNGGDAHPYNRFITASISWLLRDPEMTPLRLNVEPQTPREGEEVKGRITIADLSYKPRADHPFKVKLIRLDDPTNAESEQAVLEINDRKSGANGDVVVPFVPPGAGVYRVVVETEFEGQGVQVERRLVVDPGTQERSRIIDPENLVATLTQYREGQLVDADASLDDLTFPVPDTLLVARERERPLWNHTFVLFLVVLLLALEWAVRKRSGLP